MQTGAPGKFFAALGEIKAVQRIRCLVMGV
jgi:hypothetical protein